MSIALFNEFPYFLFVIGSIILFFFKKVTNPLLFPFPNAKSCPPTYPVSIISVPLYIINLSGLLNVINVILTSLFISEFKFIFIFWYDFAVTLIKEPQFNIGNVVSVTVGVGVLVGVIDVVVVFVGVIDGVIVFVGVLVGVKSLVCVCVGVGVLVGVLVGVWDNANKSTHVKYFGSKL